MAQQYERQRLFERKRFNDLGIETCPKSFLQYSSFSKIAADFVQYSHKLLLCPFLQTSTQPVKDPIVGCWVVLIRIMQF